MMILGHLYKHKNGRDCAIMPISVKPLRDGTEVEFRWVNVVNPANKFILDVPPTTKLFSQEYLKEWYHIGSMNDE